LPLLKFQPSYVAHHTVVTSTAHTCHKTDSVIVEEGINAVVNCTACSTGIN